MVYQWLKKKTSSDVLQNVISITEEFSSERPGIVIDRVQLIGKGYSDKTSWAKYKIIIVRFTKKHYSIFNEPIELVRNNAVVKFVMADINCRLKVVFKNGNSFC